MSTGSKDITQPVNVNKSREKPKIDTSKLHSEGVLVATKKLLILSLRGF